MARGVADGEAGEGSMITPDSLPAWFAVPAAVTLWGSLIALKVKDFFTG